MKTFFLTICSLKIKLQKRYINYSFVLVAMCIFQSTGLATFWLVWPLSLLLRGLQPSVKYFFCPNGKKRSLFYEVFSALKKSKPAICQLKKKICFYLSLISIIKVHTNSKTLEIFLLLTGIQNNH